MSGPPRRKLLSLRKGVYHVSFMVHGQRIRRSLKTGNRRQAERAAAKSTPTRPPGSFSATRCRCCRRRSPRRLAVWRRKPISPRWRRKWRPASRRSPSSSTGPRSRSRQAQKTASPYRRYRRRRAPNSTTFWQPRRRRRRSAARRKSGPRARRRVSRGGHRERRFPKHRRNARPQRGQNVAVLSRKFADVRNSGACGRSAQMVKNG